MRGLRALLVTDARRATRTDAAGRLLRLEDQDRARWERGALAEAEGAGGRRPAGRVPFYLPAVKADLLARLRRGDEAAAACAAALTLTANEAERDFLAGRLAAVRARGRESA